nr:ATP-dependent Clp protease proteolytic subunit [Amycolatopsis taiwanensis]
MPLPDRPRSRAILIGTGSYQDARLPDLPSVANNLTDLKAVLTDPDTGVFDAEHCTLVEDPTDDRRVAMLLADIATAADDVLLVYYAGHGVIGARQHELYLGLTTTDLDRPQYSALPFAWVRDELLDSRASTKVLILDCCFSGRAIDDFMADHESLVLGQVDVSGTYTLTSTSANTPALAPPGARYTAFSGELLALLRDGITAGPAELDLHLLYQQLRHRMAAKGWPIPKQRGTDNVHDLALGRNPAHLPDQPADPRITVKQMAGAHPDPAAGLLQALLTDQVNETVLHQLLGNRVLVLNTEIDDNVANRICAHLLILADEDPAADISLYINSTGGSVSAGVAIYDTIRLIEPDVSTWAIGLASGTAQLLLSSGMPGKRYALPHARILLKAAWAPGLRSKEHESLFVKWNKEIVRIIAEDTGQSVKQVEADARQARWFSAREALDYGLIDQVVTRLNIAG